MHYVITDAAENCTSCCAKSTGSNYNEVNFFFLSFTTYHIACRLANNQDHLVMNLCLMKKDKNSD